MLDVAPRSVDLRLLLVLGVGVLAVALVLGGLTVLDRVRGGASSPSVLAERFTTALGEKDLGTLVRLVEPGERAALRRLADAWSHRLADLDLPDAVGGGSGDAGPLDGIDLTFTGATPRLESRSGDLAVVGLPNLTVRVRSTPGDAHGLLQAWFTYRRVTTPSDLSYPASALPGDLRPRLVVVERSGRWFVSLLATFFGPGVAAGSTADLQAVEAAAAPDPQAAVEATVRSLFDALGRRDVDPFAATLDPSGADLARLWTSQLETPGTGQDERLDTLRTAAGPGDGRRARVRIDALEVSGGSRFELSDGCASNPPVARACLHASGYRYADGVPELSAFALLGHDGAFWLTAVNDRDAWRTSLPDSLADALISYADDLTRAQVLALLRRPTLDQPGGSLRPDVAEDVLFSTAGYALRTLHVEHAGLYRVVPSPTGGNRAAVYDADGQPSIQPFYPNDSVYRLDVGDHQVLVWADDEFVAALDRSTPYVQRMVVRSVG